MKIGSEVIVSILKPDCLGSNGNSVLVCLENVSCLGYGSLYFKAIRLIRPDDRCMWHFAGTSILLKSEEFGHLVKLSLRKS